MSALGLQCKYNEIDFIDKLLFLTLTPLAFILCLGLIYTWQSTKKQLFLNKLDRKVKTYKIPDEIQLLLNHASSCELFTFVEICNAFAFIDINGNGRTTVEEMAHAIDKLKIKDLRQDGDLEAFANSIIVDYRAQTGDDEEEAGSISFTEFCGVAVQNQDKTQIGKLVNYVKTKVDKQVGRKIMYLFLLFTFVLLVGVSGALFEFFQCAVFDLPNGSTDEYIRRDYSVDCKSTRYRTYFPFAICMLLVYPVGIPGMYAALLLHRRKVLSNPLAMNEELKTGYPRVGHIMFLAEVCASRASFLLF